LGGVVGVVKVGEVVVVGVVVVSRKGEMVLRQR